MFETAYFSDDVVNGKPHPEALLRALADLGVDPADSVYVGDTTVDLEMASSAGAPFEAVAGTTSEAAFRAAGVERVWPGVGQWVDDLLGSRRRSVARARVAVGGDVDDGVERAGDLRARGRAESAASISGSSASRGRPATNTQ